MGDLQFSQLDQWFSAMLRPSALLELLALVACAALAWLFCAGLRRSIGDTNRGSIWFGRGLVDGVLFPLLWLCLAWLARPLVHHWSPAMVFRLAMPVLIALVVIRVGVKVLQAAFKETPLVRALERSISWIAWLAMVLWVSGLLPVLLDELDQIHWRVGGTSMSLRNLIEGTLTAAAVLILSLWVSAGIESRLLRSATGSDLSLRKAFSNAARAFLILIGLLVALTAVGIDLTALSVLGGAIGVGIGFGLQKLASNYVSGFVMLAERSVRIGDNVRVDGFEGVVTDINARYTVIRALTGRESIVPNEMFIVNRVENLSLSDRQLWQSSVLLVAYDSDVDLVIRLLEAAATAQARVLRDPPPHAGLSAFAVDGLEFTLAYWIADPENGQLNLRSAINLAILRSLRENGVRIPPPQRATEGAKPLVDSLKQAP